MAKILISIKADRDVKEKAKKIAQQLGLPLSVIVNAYLRQFIRTKEVHFSVEGALKPSAKKRLSRIHKEVLEGKNLSPAFYTAKEMDAYLDSLEK